jgi:two-component system, OmpR family, response regulator
MRILVVDDHDETRDLITRNFARAAHSVQTASSCAEAARAIGASEFDIILLDVMLPDGSGIELCSQLRQRGCAVPVLLLTARNDVRDRVRGLDAGADDYLVKPFALAELIARVRALGRRGPILRDRTLLIGSLQVDLERRCVSVDGRNLPLTAKEIAIVELLATRRGVVARETLMESVWGDVSEASRASLDVFIGRIRRKLEGHGAVLRTVRGLGYALESRE